MTNHRDLPLFAWTSPPQVVPFPTAKRQDFILRHARRMAEMHDEKAEGHLQRLLAQLSSKLTSFGCNPMMVRLEVDQAETAIRDRYRVARAIGNSEGLG